LDTPVTPHFVRVDHVDGFCRIRTGRFGFELEEMFLWDAVSKTWKKCGTGRERRQTFQGRNCSKRRILPLGSTLVPAATDEMRMSLAGSHAFA